MLTFTSFDDLHFKNNLQILIITVVYYWTKYFIYYYWHFQERHILGLLHLFLCVLTHFWRIVCTGKCVEFYVFIQIQIQTFIFRFTCRQRMDLSMVLNCGEVLPDRTVGGVWVHGWDSSNDGPYFSCLWDSHPIERGRENGWLVHILHHQLDHRCVTERTLTPEAWVKILVGRLNFKSVARLRFKVKTLKRDR